MVKKILILSTLLVITLMWSCKKDNTPDNGGTPLVFSSLTASDTLIHVGNITTLTATATGDELTYTWESQSGYGTIVGSGAVVTWSVCHSDIFYVKCDVSDKYGDTQSKTIRINVKP